MGNWKYHMNILGNGANTGLIESHSKVRLKTSAPEDHESWGLLQEVFIP